MYALLLGGAVTMVWPLLEMCSGSLRGASDQRERTLVPAYLREDAALWRRYVEALFNESLDLAVANLDADAISFERFPVPAAAPAGLVDAWEGFLAGGGAAARPEGLGFIRAEVSRTVPLALRDFREELAGRFDGDCGRLNREWGTDFSGWSGFHLQVEDRNSRRNAPPPGPFLDAFLEFKSRQPAWMRFDFSVEGFYRRVFLRSRYGRDVAALNRAHGTGHASFDDAPLPGRAPAAGGARTDWELFVREIAPPAFVRVDGGAAPADLSGVEVSRLSLDTVEGRFRDHLRDRFGGDAAAAGAALGLRIAAFDAIRAPLAAAQHRRFAAAVPAIRREFAARNFRTVFDHVARHGRGLRNTAIYCALAVLCALVVNPLAAYALSRHRPRATYAILLFLMLTMAFPAMVTQIPAFLMLRDLGLLNTFAALVLPGLANGYSIFLLKGFFDSLPRELYESAELDGAGEWTIFWTLTMSLSRPILAVIALHAFTAAYSNFMFALLICQDERMWTLMVWLYQLQNRSGMGVIHASLLVAAVPTLLVFLFCQRIILRGIVIPVEK
jgi:multiple sugar transport system permease protein